MYEKIPNKFDATLALVGGGISGDYAPSYGRDDGVVGNPRGPPAMNIA